MSGCFLWLFWQNSDSKKWLYPNHLWQPESTAWKTVPSQNKSEKTLSIQVAKKYRDKIYHGKRLLKDKGETVFLTLPSFRISQFSGKSKSTKNLIQTKNSEYIETYNILRQG